MSSDSLQDILSYAENLNMPEGDYLSVANALKTAFKNINNNKWITYSTDNINDICLFFNNGMSDVSAKNYIKSISASNIKEPGPIKFKLHILSELIYKNNPDKNKTFEYIIQPYGHRLGKLYILSEIINPTNINIKFNEIETEYECFSYLKELKDRDDQEHKINFPDDSENEDFINIDRFLHDIRCKFINLCENWFMSKYNENEE